LQIQVPGFVKFDEVNKGKDELEAEHKDPKDLSLDKHSEDSHETYNDSNHKVMRVVNH